MGGKRKRPRRSNKDTPDRTVAPTKSGDDGPNRIPPAWTLELVTNAEREKSPPEPDAFKDVCDLEPTVEGVGLHIARATLRRISARGDKNRKGSNAKTKAGRKISDVKPTPIQLRLWPALLHSFDWKASSAEALNVVGIAPTGTGKTLAYCIPIVSHCVRNLLLLRKRQQAAPRKLKQWQRRTTNTMVHGTVLVPTRELAIQVAKEIGAVAKVANKYLRKFCRAGDNDVVGNASEIRVESVAVYGGVDAHSQISSLLGRKDKEEPTALGHPRQRSLIVVATAGRLLDILKQQFSDDEKQEESMSVSGAFTDLQAIVFDEADRMAVNADMAGQVKEILSILKKAVQGSKEDHRDDYEGIVSCLVSATLPDKAKQICERWVPQPRIVVKIDPVKMGGGKAQQSMINDNHLNPAGMREEDGRVKNEDCAAGGISPKKVSIEDRDEDDEEKKHNLEQDILSLSSIPSNIVQTLHVCSNHKKPKKLVLTLRRIYSQGKDRTRGSGRFSVYNRLCIVFFTQIKTVKYTSKLLLKEGLRCVELHGSLNQPERERRLLEFKAGKRTILLATDVAARGLHIPNVHYVVNYDFPGSLDQYVHRCGRAGRKQALSGEVSQYPPTVYSFFTREFAAMADSVIELLNGCQAWVDPNLLALRRKNNQSSATKKSTKSRRKRKRKHDLTSQTESRSSKEVVVGDHESEVDQFSFLGQSVLKRASHVSDAEDSDDDDATCTAT